MLASCTRKQLIPHRADSRFYCTRSDLEDGGEVPRLEEIRINTADKKFRVSGTSAIELPRPRTTYGTRAASSARHILTSRHIMLPSPADFFEHRHTTVNKNR